MFRQVCACVFTGLLALVSAPVLAAGPRARGGKAATKHHVAALAETQVESRHEQFKPDPEQRNDAYGYFCLDEDQPGGPVFDWIDTSGATNTGISGDDERGLVNLPFTFNFYGIGYTSLWVCTNGWAAFGPDPNTSEWDNMYVPDGYTPDQAVYPLWDDLYVFVGHVYEKTVGVAPNRRFAVIWDNLEYYDEEDSSISFELVLNEADQDIVFQYFDVLGGGGGQSFGGSATVAIESHIALPGGQTGLNYSYDEQVLDSAKVIRFWVPSTSTNDMGVLTLDDEPEFVRIGDSTRTVADVRNFGTAEQGLGVPVKLRITGPAGYCFEDVDQVTDSSLRRGRGVAVTFAPRWVAPNVTGDYWVSVWTELLGDENLSNDTIHYRLRVMDFCETFSDTAFPPPKWARGRFAGDADWYRYQPASPVARFPCDNAGDKAWLCSPRLDLTRWSSDSIVFSCLCNRGGGSVRDTLVVQITTDGGASWYSLDTLSAPHSDWTRCAYDLETVFGQTDQCYIRLIGISAGGQEILIDDVAGPPKFRFDHDVGVTGILAPQPFLEPQPVVPTAVVTNEGLSTEGPFQVSMKIQGASYERTTEVGVLGPYESAEVEFPMWNAPFGTFQARCSTMLGSDQSASNDLQVRQVNVLRYLEPFEQNNGGYHETHNLGSYWWRWSDCWLTDQCGPNVDLRLYSCHLRATASSPVLYFRHMLRSSSGLDGGNMKYSTDGQTWTLLEDPVPPYGGPVAGLGGQAGYSGWDYSWDTVSVVVPVETGQVFQIRWDYGSDPSLYGGDGWWIDDVAGVEFCRWDAFSQGWTEMQPVPAAPTVTKPPKDGAWLASGLGSAGEPVLFAAKGNKTGDFYRFDPLEGTLGVWNELESIPGGEAGRAKLPKKGCAATPDGQSFIYMTKGNNTPGFWRYHIQGDSWQRLPDVPLGSDGKKVKGGTDLAYVQDGDTGWVYLLKGYRTSFYRFNAVSRVWDSTLDDVPYGVAPKYNAGSFLVYDGVRYLYAHQSKYTDALKSHHYMFKYDLATHAWQPETQVKGMPVVGMDGGKMKRKKSKDGGAGAWYDGRLYALKGGNTCQFYRYDPPGDSWHEMDTMKSVGSTGKKKKVKAGGDLVSWGHGAFFALKGNKTYEFWRYYEGPPQVADLRPQVPRGVQAGESTASHLQFEVVPNPVTNGFATLRFRGSAAGRSCGSVRIFDAAGRCVFSRPFVIGDWPLGVPLNMRSFVSGVYVARLYADGCVATREVLVVRK